MYKICLFLLIVIGCCIKKIYDDSLQKELLHQVSWWAISGFPGRTSSLLEYIYNIQSELDVETKYCIGIKDIGAFEEQPAINILAACVKDMELKYFTGELNINRGIARLEHEEYFMFILNEFLSKHRYEVTFNENSMYIITDTKYNEKRSGFGWEEATYKFTDYAVVYHKLYLLSALFREQNENIKKIYKLNKNYSDSIKEALDKKEIRVRRY